MKNLSLALNAVLFILVGILFFLHFNPSKKGNTAAPVDKKGIAVSTPQIAYIDIDSFQNSYTYFKNGQAALESKQKAMEAELNRSISSFQAEYQKLAQNAQTMTEEQGMAAQQRLQTKQQQIEEKKQTMEAQFMQETQNFNIKLQERIIEYLKKYNADGKYTYILPYSKSTINLLYVNEINNITADVLKGMNEEYATSKK